MKTIQLSRKGLSRALSLLTIAAALLAGPPDLRAEDGGGHPLSGHGRAPSPAAGSGLTSSSDQAENGVAGVVGELRPSFVVRRVVLGQAPEGAAGFRVTAFGSDGSRVTTAASPGFTLALRAGVTYSLGGSQANHAPAPIRFDGPKGLPARTHFVATSAPNALDLGALRPAGNEFRVAAGPLAACDLDGDGVADALDADADGDGLPNVEDPDADGDGVPDAVEEADKRNDGMPTPVALDRDGDGVADQGADTDGDLVPDLADVDVDNDGLENVDDPDFDGDGKPDTAREAAALALRAAEGGEVAGAREFFAKAYVLAPGDGVVRLGLALARLGAVFADENSSPSPAFVETAEALAARFSKESIRPALENPLGWFRKRQARRLPAAEPTPARLARDALFDSVLLSETRGALALLEGIPAGFSENVTVKGASRHLDQGEVLAARGAVRALQALCLLHQALGSGPELARSGGNSRANGSDQLARGQPSLEAGVFQPQTPRPRLQLGLPRGAAGSGTGARPGLRQRLLVATVRARTAADRARLEEARAVWRQGVDDLVAAFDSIRAEAHPQSAELLVLRGSPRELEQQRRKLLSAREALADPVFAGAVRAGQLSIPSVGNGAQRARPAPSIGSLSLRVSPDTLDLSRAPAGSFTLAVTSDDPERAQDIRAVFADAVLEGRPLLSFARLAHVTDSARERGATGKPPGTRWEGSFPIQAGSFPRSGTVKFTLRVVHRDGKTVTVASDATLRVHR